MPAPSVVVVVKYDEQSRSYIARCNLCNSLVTQIHAELAESGYPVPNAVSHGCTASYFTAEARAAAAAQAIPWQGYGRL